MAQYWIVLEKQCRETYPSAKATLTVGSLPRPHHRETGGASRYLAQRWLLPQSLVYAIYYHHGIKGNVGDHDALIAIVGFANNLVHMMEEDPGYHVPTEQEYDRTTNLLRDLLHDNDQWWIDIKKEMDAACLFFDKG